MIVVDDRPAQGGAEPVSGERRFQLLVDGVHDYAIYMLDPHGVVSSWNSGAQRFKGYTADEIIGQHFSRFFTEADRKAGLPQRALATALAEGRFETEGWRVRKDGTQFWVNAVIDPIRDENGVHIGFAKITRDITERRKAQEELEEARAALHQAHKMEALGQLTGGVAHDFNNLLQVIGSSLEAMERRLAAGRTDVERYAQAARTAVDRATGLTQRLLAFARRQPLTPGHTDVAALLSGMRDLIQRSMGEATRVEMVLPDDPWAIWVDTNQIEAALLNLAINARDAMPDGGTLTVAATNIRLGAGAAFPALPPGDYVRISVTDTGTGMPPNVVARAFEPFFTTKPVGQGTGLGLSQLYGFVHQSGGDVRIDSAVGRGTTVALTLPRHHGAPEAATDTPAETPADTPAGMETPTATPLPPCGTVLLVEDEALVRMVLADALRDQGFTVLEAGDGNAALRVIESSAAIDLLATDIGLPGINGRQLAETAQARRPGLTVLFLTGYAYRNGGDEPLRANTHLLSKPVSVETFLATVNDLVTRRKTPVAVP